MSGTEVLPMRHYLLYKGVNYKWCLSQEEINVDNILRDILDTDIGSNVSVSQHKFGGLVNPLKKLICKISQVDQHYTMMVKEKALSGLVIGKNVLPALKLLIPSGLVGGKKNKQKILFSIRKAFKFGYKDVIPLNFFMANLDIKKVAWLKTFDSKEKKHKIMSKLVMWLWKVTKNLVASKYYISETQSTCKKITYIPKRMWQSQSDSAFNSLVNRGILQPLSLVEINQMKQFRESATLRWIPKDNGLRPIISVKSDKHNEEIILCKAFLRDILKDSYTNLNNNKLHEVWSDIVKKYRENDIRQLYFVTIDIHDAYGSIIQEKLEEIIKQKVCSKLTEVKMINFYTVWVNNKLKIVCRELSKDKFSFTKAKKTVELETVMNTIINTIKCQTVKKKESTYILAKGISQAMPLSAALCNLYLSRIDDTFLKDFKNGKENTLLRKVDDYLFVSSNKEAAERFLKTMTAGFQDYGIFINENKTKSNLTGDLEITYLGYSINTYNWELYVKYSHGINVPFRNLTTFSHKLPPMKTLEEKMRRVPTWKLNKLVTDRSYMSVSGVVRNVFQTGCMMACCFKATVDTFRDTDVVTQDLFEIIMTSVNKVASSVDMTKCLIRWVVIRAFWLCLSHGATSGNSKIPEALIMLLKHSENKAQEAVNPLTIKRLLRVVGVLPQQFLTGY